MAAPFRTYLDLCNTILRELNEVELTSTTFTSALGIQKFVKDTINRAYFDICNAEDKWNFLSVGDPLNDYYGNAVIETVAGTRWYDLQSAQTDCDYLDLVMDNNPDKLEAKQEHLIPVLVQAIKELSAEVEQLKSQLNN